MKNVVIKALIRMNFRPLQFKYLLIDAVFIYAALSRAFGQKLSSMVCFAYQTGLIVVIFENLYNHDNNSVIALKAHY